MAINAKDTHNIVIRREIKRNLICEIGALFPCVLTDSNSAAVWCNLAVFGVCCVCEEESASGADFSSYTVTSFISHSSTFLGIEKATQLPAIIVLTSYK
ncbi:hypothetical protein [Candidatus Ichthyocystis hellenicum]|uniref:hypothetical protein n=1 Tax=Candidatus Ichthyocystis hellenicum TaxID=1561003 RepID=UPI000B85006B|nr:hypothetical protein [Candidatus Ichthyocystis hellenicum]